MTRKIEHPATAPIVAFGNKSNQKLETALWAFALDVDPEFKLRKLYRIVNRITPERYRFNWTGAVTGSRSEEYRRNAWLNFTPIFYAARDDHVDQETSETVTSDDLRRFCGAWMEHWHAAFPFNPDDPSGGALDNRFAWYDMAVGVRAALLSQILFHKHRDVLPAPMVENLISCAREHLEALRLTETWASHSNHGFFQSAGLFALSVQTPDISDDAERDRELAGQRLKTYLQSTFSEDGIHLEHSCEYHNFMFKSLGELAPLLEEERPSEAWIANLFVRMQEAMSAMILPNHLVAPFGDGRYTTADATIPKSPAVLDTLKPVLKADLLKQDTPADISPLRTFREGGFAVYKQRGDPAHNSYLAVSAWHHSIVHKHVDELSPIWAENSVPILSDAGRYGYEGKTEDNSQLRKEGFFYGDPKRIFVESAHAHNTVEIDGRSDNRRLALPYQSGIAASEILPDGRTVIDTEIVREPSVRHQRLFVYTPGKSLVVVDELTDLKWVNANKPVRFSSRIKKFFSREQAGKEQLPAARTYTQWHQFFPAWLVTEATSDLVAEFHPGWKGEYFDDPNTQTSLLSEKVIPEAGYRVRAGFGAWTAEDGAHRPDQKLYRGNFDERGRHAGWASLWPLMLKPTSAVGQTVTTRGRTAIFVAVFDIQANSTEGQPVNSLDIHTEEQTARTIRYRIGAGEPESLLYERTDDRLSLTMSDGQQHDVSRSLVARNQDVQALYKARMAHIARAPKAEVSELFRAASANGWSKAINEAAAYEKSIGNDEKQLELASQAQAQGSGEDTLKLALIHLDRKGSAFDPEKAKALLNVAVEKNVRSAHFYLGNLYSDKSLKGHDLAKAKDEYRKGAMREHLGSMLTYAVLLSDEADYRGAVKWLKAAGKNGSADAYLRLGKLYSTKGQAPEFYNMSIAAEFYEKAGLAGNKMGAYAGATIFMDVNMEAYDMERAVVLLKIAAELGSDVASQKLAKLGYPAYS
jgi:hypothetical protein